MENIISALKIFIPMLLTPIINRIISTFRIRQLYLAFENVHPCSLPNSSGFVASMHAYNKGKDKESKIEITIPNTKECHIISTSYPGTTTSKNSITIDRLLSKQTVTLMVYFDSTTPISAANRPHIKSEDSNGKAYAGKDNVPPSLGPAVMIASILSAIAITFTLTIYTDTNVLYPYHALRYKNMLEQGLEPSRFSDNTLISQASFKSPSPFQIAPPIIKNKKITIPIKIKNTTNKTIKANIYPNLNNSNYEAERERAYVENLDWENRLKALNKIESKYGYYENDTHAYTDILIPPGEEQKIEITRTIIPTTTPDNLNFKIRIERGSYDDPAFNDFYTFNIINSPHFPEIKKAINNFKSSN